MSNNGLTRRQFLGRAGAVAAAAAVGPMIVPASVLGAEGRAAANSRINVGLIGCGGQGTSDLNPVMWGGETQIVAVCDVDRSRRDGTRDMINRHYAERVKVPDYKGCAAYTDFRELLDKGDVNAVIIGTPDHWHAIVAIAAAKAGCDIYCEKPMSLTIREARAMVNAVRRYGRVFQTGSQQRSEYEGKFRMACELVRNGYIGQVKEVFVSVGGPSEDCYLPAEPVPDGMDWDMWLGPAPWRPYNHGLHPFNWRSFRDYSGGGMTDWGAHHFDIAQWGLGMDDSGPVEVHPPDGKDYPCLTYKYANGVLMYHAAGEGRKKLNNPTGREGVHGVLFVGTDGWVEVDRDFFETYPASLKTQPLNGRDIRLYKAVGGHGQNWVQCIRTRQRPICDVEIGCRSITVCHLGNIAYWLNRPLKWDPVKEEIVGDAEAARWLDRPKRAPWTV